jgi:hypothetical protein
VTDDGVAGDAVIWINLTDGVLATDAEPALSIEPGGIQDTFANPNAQTTGFPSVDSAPPILMSCFALVGETNVFVKFSEPVSAGATPVGLGDFAYSDGGNPIQLVMPTDPGLRSSAVYIALTNALTVADIQLPHTITPAAGIVDQRGLPMAAAAHNISDLLLGAAFPVWASDGNVGSIKTFNGSKKLENNDIILQIRDTSGLGVTLFYDLDVPDSLKTNGIWLPTAVAGVVATPNTAAKSLAPYYSAGGLHNFRIPSTDLTNGSRLEFVLRLGAEYCTRIINPQDPKTVGMWSFMINDIKRQAGGVTILNNVINASRGEKTKLVYTLSSAGRVTILVSDMKGDIVKILFRGHQSAGDYFAEWDGRNRGDRVVAPGMYFVKIVGPNINQIRKILVVKRAR